MALFTKSQLDKVNAIAAKSTQAIASTKAVDSKSIVDELNAISEEVLKYFHDSEAQEITTVEELHDYITKCLATKDKIVGYDTETTGLDRIHDTIVGFSLYYPGGVEVYVPINHKVPIFDTRYPNQLTYEDVRPELQRLVDGNAKLIMANADFDIAMTYKDIKVDLKDVTYYDVILAWRCLREDEKDNSLKGLYAKYPMKGKIVGKKFSDFFSPQLFPYAKPSIAKLYAANDAKITVELFFWQLPYVTKSNPKCQKNHLEKIADLIWNIEIPMIPVCAELHRNGIYLEQSIAEPLQIRWANKLESEQAKLAKMVDEIVEAKDTPYNSKRPFTSGRDFNARSSKPVMYLLVNLLGLDIKKANKETLADYSNIPVVAQILKIRSLGTIISTFVDKLPKAVAPDGRIHGEFKSIGAATGRMCIAKGEMVQLANDTEIPIEKVEVGMYVSAFSGTIGESPVEPHRVINKWKTGQDRECVEVCTDTTSVICTPEHQFYVARKGWVQAKDLTPTDRLIFTATLPIGNERGYITEHQKVKSVDKLDKHFDVYDIEVENAHHFIVNGICVHNSSQNPNMQNIPSHATDIRHLFRATPEITENMSCEPYDGVVTLKLFQADSLPTINGKYIMVKDIKMGDQVRFELDHKEYFLEVKSKSDLDRFGCAQLIFNCNSNVSVLTKHPDYVIMSSDFSQQEPKLTAFMSGTRGLIESFQQGKDIYSTIASIAFQMPYEECCEFHPVTGEKQPEGKERRSIAKVIVLGLNYGMSTESIGQDVFAHDDTMTDEEKTKRADEIFDAVMSGFPELNNAIKSAQYKARTLGYTETMLGRRRHHPNMQLPYFEFEPMKGYVNPDIDPLDPDTMQNRDKIPARIIESLNKEFDSYQAKNQYWKISKRTKELAAEQIKVINNTKKITEASRQVWNCVTKDTEILTTAGWKRYNEVSAGDKVLSYSIERQLIEEDTIQAIHIYNEPTEVVEFKSPTFSAASTRNHRWVVCTSKETPHIKTTQDIERHKWLDFPILRVGNNKFSEYSISDDELKLLGWVLTDGSTLQGRITLSQSTTNPKNAAVYKDMVTTLDKLGLEYTDHVYGNQEHSIYLRACDYTKQLAKAYEHRVLKPELVSNLSQRQCRVLMQAMLQGDGQGVDGTGVPVGNNNAVLTCNSQEKVDVFQYLVFRAGYASSSKKYMPEDYNQSKSANTVYESVGNTSPIRMKNPYYTVTVYNIIRAHIYEHHKHSMIAEDGVWCVSTSNQTWVARRDGKVYITGNSVIQGSAADLTKMAMLRLMNNAGWRKIGGRFLTPVHDELIVEVPYVFREEGAAILKESMEGAGSFLPFVIKCDIEQTLRWYGVGLDELLEFDKPAEFNWDTMTESNIKWLQCMLLESEYILPTFDRADGKKLDGIEAKGVNGIVSEDMKSFCSDYMRRYGITEADFINHIHRKVMYGVS